MTVHPWEDQAGLLFEARRALGLSREDFAALVSLSKRTAARWETGQSRLGPDHLFELARHVHPKNAAIAEKLALAGGSTLEKLGIVAVAPALPRGLPDAVLVDSIVCVAADAMKAVPDTLRAALLAACRRAREVGMTLDDVEKALADPTPPAPRPAGRAGGA
ncbi:MAG TPA: helix-turn-helix transcriptional regulator [Polyangiaceae bacterium]